MKLVSANYIDGVGIAVFEEERHTQDRFHAIATVQGVESYGRTAERAFNQLRCILQLKELLARKGK